MRQPIRNSKRSRQASAPWSANSYLNRRTSHWAILGAPYSLRSQRRQVSPLRRDGGIVRHQWAVSLRTFRLKLAAPSSSDRWCRRFGRRSSEQAGILGRCPNLPSRQRTPHVDPLDWDQPLPSVLDRRHTACPQRQTRRRHPRRTTRSARRGRWRSVKHFGHATGR